MAAALASVKARIRLPLMSVPKTRGGHLEHRLGHLQRRRDDPGVVADHLLHRLQVADLLVDRPLDVLEHRQQRGAERNERPVNHRLQPLEGLAELHRLAGVVAAHDQAEPLGLLGRLLDPLGPLLEHGQERRPPRPKMAMTADVFSPMVQALDLVGHRPELLLEPHPGELVGVQPDLLPARPGCRPSARFSRIDRRLELSAPTPACSAA
jgi:hypothetical protein